MIRYPNGKKYIPQPVAKKTTAPQKQAGYGNRGMTLEEDLNETNEYYLAKGIAVIHKKPTPVQIVQVDYPKRSAAVIKEAYFKQASTTDYNGVYKGRYIDFEAKETKNASSFPLKNFHEHQIQHMRLVSEQDGISFVIIRFSQTNEVFLLESSMLLVFWSRMQSGGRKSIHKDELKAHGVPLLLGLHPRIDYLQAVDTIWKHFF